MRSKKIESKTTAKLSLDVIALLRTYEIEVCRHSQVNWTYPDQDTRRIDIYSDDCSVVSWLSAFIRLTTAPYSNYTPVAAAADTVSAAADAGHLRGAAYYIGVSRHGTIK